MVGCDFGAFERDLRMDIHLASLSALPDFMSGTWLVDSEIAFYFADKQLTVLAVYVLL